MESGKFLASNAGRLDKVLSFKLQKSRNQIEKLIKDGLVKVNGKIVLKRSFKVSSEDEIEYKFIEAKVQDYSDIDIEIERLYEDDDILVINKPSGLVVHPAPSVKEPTLVDWLRKQNIRLSTISGEERNGIVHRLDKDTSGAILIAKSNFAHEALSKQLQDRSMGRYYLAVINYPLKDNLIVNKPIARNPKNRLKMAIVEGGKEAKTAFTKVVQSSNNSELIVAKLFSGRTHQIRVHLTTLNRYILGDRLYGANDQKLEHRMFLHAYLLYFIHPISGKLVEVKAPLFSDMQEYFKKNFNKDREYDNLTKDEVKNCFKNFTT